jgi:hypothetical protein
MWVPSVGQDDPSVILFKTRRSCICHLLASMYSTPASMSLLLRVAAACLALECLHCFVALVPISQRGAAACKIRCVFTNKRSEEYLDVVGLPGSIRLALVLWITLQGA